MKISSLIRRAAMVIAMLAMIGESAVAQDPRPVETPELYELTLQLGLEHSDNRARTSPRGSSETALVPRMDLDLSRSGQRLALRVAGDVEQRINLHGPFGNDFQANLAARLNWQLVEESLAWLVENVASGAPLDLTGQDTLENRQQTNVFSTGPRWVLRPAAPWSGLFDARYIHSYAEDSAAFNSDRVLLAARAVRRLGGGRQVSIGAETIEVGYRDAEFAAADYRRLDLIGRYRAARAALEIDVAAGRTRIDLDRGQELEGNLARLRLAWTVDDRNSLVASVGHELSDSVRQLLADIEQLDLPVAGHRRLPVGNEFYVLDSLALGWRYRFGRLSGGVTVARRDYQFEFDPALDLKEQGLDLGLTWRVTRSLALEGGMGLERRRFSFTGRRDTDARASLFVIRRFNPRWSGRVGVIRHQRDSNIVGEDSRENIAAVYLVYYAGR